MNGEINSSDLIVDYYFWKILKGVYGLMVKMMLSWLEFNVVRIYLFYKLIICVYFMVWIIMLLYIININGLK